MWPGIIGPSVGALSVLSLLPFFQHFRDDSPYHLAGVAALQEAMPAELLQEDSDWFEAWRAAGIDQEVFVPYFQQLTTARRMVIVSPAPPPCSQPAPVWSLVR